MNWIFSFGNEMDVGACFCFGCCCNVDHIVLCERTSDMKTYYLGRELIMVLSLDLHAFILQGRVLKLYRQALRTTRRAPSYAKGEAFKPVNPFFVQLFITL